MACDRSALMRRSGHIHTTGSSLGGIEHAKPDGAGVPGSDRERSLQQGLGQYREDGRSLCRYAHGHASRSRLSRSRSTWMPRVIRCTRNNKDSISRLSPPPLLPPLLRHMRRPCACGRVRPSTIDAAKDALEESERVVGPIPELGITNRSDLRFCVRDCCGGARTAGFSTRWG